MHKSGLLILSKFVKKQTLAPLLIQARKVVEQNLFLAVPLNSLSFPYWKNAVFECYSAASEICPSLNVCVLLPAIDKFQHSVKFDVVLASEADYSPSEALAEAHKFDPSCEDEILCTAVDPLDSGNGCMQPVEDSPVRTVGNVYSHVCLGGTFDLLHGGHKILLTVGALLASQRLVIGITAPSMIRSKHLAPLIPSWKSRCKFVSSFLSNIGMPSSRVEVVEISDPFGPPAVDPRFECIVASQETLSNCVKLNEIRVERGFKPLSLEKIEFVLDTVNAAEKPPAKLDDYKLSSSTNRFYLLGKLLRPVNKAAGHNRGFIRPYVIGLAGPSGSGKSALARRLANLSSAVHIVDCDQLGHKAYEPGSACYEMLIAHFGFEAIASPTPPHPIDRGRLGKLVFSDPRRLDELNKIVWPEIKKQIQEILCELDAKRDPDGSRPIVVLDAAVLFQAKWDLICDEVWVAVLPREEAQRRICERNKITPEAANDRLSRQSSAIASCTGGLDWWDSGQIDTGLGPVGHAHVVLSTEWEPECSQAQVQRAFSELLKRIPSVD